MHSVPSKQHLYRSFKICLVCLECQHSVPGRETHYNSLIILKGISVGEGSLFLSPETQVALPAKMACTRLWLVQDHYHIIVNRTLKYGFPLGTVEMTRPIAKVKRWWTLAFFFSAGNTLCRQVGQIPSGSGWDSWCVLGMMLLPYVRLKIYLKLGTTKRY